MASECAEEELGSALGDMPFTRLVPAASDDEGLQALETAVHDASRADTGGDRRVPATPRGPQSHGRMGPVEAVVEMPAMALTVTHISAAAASLTWALWERVKYGKASLVGMVTGTIAGLASITPASGFVGPVEALIIGAIAGVLCQEAVNIIRNRLKIDDTLDVFAVHGVGGMFGIIMIATFGQGAWVAQLGGLAVVGVYTIVVTVALALIVKAIVGLRVDEETEVMGLDLAQHGERAYDVTS